MEIPGVSWESPEFQFFDNGKILNKKTNQTIQGKVGFGIVDERNVFHRVENLQWNNLRKDRKRSSDIPPILPFDDSPIFVPTQDLDALFEETIRELTLKLVQIAIPEVGPPIILPLGVLLQDGTVYLNNGMEIPGIFWESPDRILYENGTILYKLTQTQEIAEIVYATLDTEGAFDFLPPITASLENFRTLNSRPASRNLQVTLNDFNLDQDDWTSIRNSRSKRSIFEKLEFIKKHLNFSNLLLSKSKNIKIQDLICQLARNIHDLETLDLIKNYKPEYSCFYKKIIHFCSLF